VVRSLELSVLVGVWWMRHVGKDNRNYLRRAPRPDHPAAGTFRCVRDPTDVIRNFCINGWQH